MAVAHSILRTICDIPRDKRTYEDLGPDYCDALDTARIERYHMHRLEQLDYTVTPKHDAA